jgi:hypothetical protein
VTTRAIRISGHPKSVIGTPAWTGPYSRLRSNEFVRQQQAYRAWRLTELGGMSIRDAAETLGMSVTTTWRRARWFADYTLNSFYGLPNGPVPHQRGTRACPRGRPIILPLDARDVLDGLLADGCTLADVIAAERTVPTCIRDVAYSRMLWERLDDDARAWLDDEAARRRKPAPIDRLR